MGFHFQREMTLPGTEEHCAIRTFGTYAGGEELDEGEWEYVIHARALLDDAFSTLSLKRQLEAGELSPDEAPTGVIAGRVARAGLSSNERALNAAAQAWREWSERPVSVRVDGFMGALHDRLIAKADEIVDVMTTERHPIDLARWELSGLLHGTDRAARDYLRTQLETESVDDDGRRVIVRRRADGVVCVNPPYNAPWRTPSSPASLWQRGMPWSFAHHAPCPWESCTRCAR